MPKQAGDRVQRDRRAALPLARVDRSGALPPVSVPQVDDEALRDLPRARAEGLSALKEATCRRNACVLRQARRAAGRGPRGPAPPRGRGGGGGAPPPPPPRLSADHRPPPPHPPP